MSICMYVSAVPGRDLLQYMHIFIDSFIVIILADYSVHVHTYTRNIVFPKQRATALILTWIGSWLTVRCSFSVSLFSCPLLVLILVCDSYCIYTLKYVMASLWDIHRAVHAHAPHMTSDAHYTFQFPICPLTPWGMVNSTHTLKETHGASTCLHQTEFFVLSSSVDVRW